MIIWTEEIKASSWSSDDRFIVYIASNSIIIIIYLLIQL